MAESSAVAEKKSASVGIRPLGDRVVLRPEDEQTKQSAGGIFIPDTAKEKPQIGEVAAVGPGRVTDEGKTIPMTVAVGQKVLFSKYAGTEYTENGTDYLVVRESDILAVVE